MRLANGKKRLPQLLGQYRNDNRCTLVYFTLTVTFVCNLLTITDKRTASMYPNLLPFSMQIPTQISTSKNKGFASPCSNTNPFC